jgi:hypothetical protein
MYANIAMGCPLLVSSVRKKIVCTINEHQDQQGKQLQITHMGTVGALFPTGTQSPKQLYQVIIAFVSERSRPSELPKPSYTGRKISASLSYVTVRGKG